jgi:hypothetical protein
VIEAYPTPGAAFRPERSVMTIEELLAIEEIKNLRYAYSAHFDKQDLDALVQLFTDDAVCDFGEYGHWEGSETIRRNYAENMALVGSAFDSIHVVTNPWIRLTGPATAHGRWYLLDLLTRQKPVTALETRGGHDHPLLWLAIYEDDYRRVGTEWKIASCKLSFLWPSRTYTGLRHE